MILLPDTTFKAAHAVVDRQGPMSGAARSTAHR
jgi:hypothetical protein